MEVRRSRLGLALVQGVLLALCAASALVVAAWLLGYNGLGLVDGAVMPDRLEQANVVMNEPVLVQGRAGVATVAAANQAIGGMPTGEVRPGDGTAEFYGNQANLDFWAPTRAQHAAWVAVRALPAAGLAGIWWLLARTVHDVRHDRGFTPRIARRLRVIGGLVLLGVPLLQLTRWEVARWLLETSTASGIADVPALRLEVWPFAAGLVILVLASAWGETIRMREDLEGLV